jgi:hypothetical protein
MADMNMTTNFIIPDVDDNLLRVTSLIDKAYPGRPEEEPDPLKWLSDQVVEEMTFKMKKAEEELNINVVIEAEKAKSKPIILVDSVTSDLI